MWGLCWARFMVGVSFSSVLALRGYFYVMSYTACLSPAFRAGELHTASPCPITLEGLFVTQWLCRSASPLLWVPPKWSPCRKAQACDHQTAAATAKSSFHQGRPRDIQRPRAADWTKSLWPCASDSQNCTWMAKGERLMEKTKMLEL